MSQVSPKQFPLSVARSTGEESLALLAALLEADSFDEISNADGFEAVEDYIKSRGRVDAGGKTTNGVSFWVYPTGLHGPFHKTDDGQVKLHGVLLTIEAGVLVEEAVKRARAALKENVITHEHISG